MKLSARTTVPGPMVDLVFDADCPNVDDARTLLHAALAAVGLPAQWREWDRAGAETPDEFRGLGSPTILVDGVDVSGVDNAEGVGQRANCCRVYSHDGELRGVPALTTIVTRLARRGTTP